MDINFLTYGYQSWMLTYYFPVNHSTVLKHIILEDFESGHIVDYSAFVESVGVRQTYNWQNYPTPRYLFISGTKLPDIQGSVSNISSALQK